jgi:hypothetical protein
MSAATGPADRMTLAAFLAAREAIFAAARAYDTVKPDCRSCANFEMGDCKHFGAPVPAEFQQQAGECEHWLYDGIPF